METGGGDEGLQSLVVMGPSLVVVVVMVAGKDGPTRLSLPGATTTTTTTTQ